MAIVEGEVGSLKMLRETLAKNGITRFKSLGEINRFLKNYEAERARARELVEAALDGEMQEARLALARQQKIYEGARATAEREIRQEVRQLESDIEKLREKAARNFFYRMLHSANLSRLQHRRLVLEEGFADILDRKTAREKMELERLEARIAGWEQNRQDIILQRSQGSLGELARIKALVDGLYPLIAGAVGETAVVRTLQQLPDDHYLLNDFSLRFARPIYNRADRDRIFSIQIDHLLVCRSGVFLLETKNWSEESLESLDLRSPVQQVRRTSFALFVLLNHDSSGLHLGGHHWGDRKIPIRNIIVMTRKKPRESFRHVKVLSLDELNGYIRYFEPMFGLEETGVIFNYLKSRMAVW